MKKTVLLFMITIMLIFVFSCGVPSKTPSEIKESSSENSEPKINEDAEKESESDDQKNTEDKKKVEKDKTQKVEKDKTKIETTPANDDQANKVEKDKTKIETTPANDDQANKVEKVPLDDISCNHDYVKATCVKPKTCKKCGLITGNVIGHTWSNWSTEVAATTEKNGLEKRHCTVCEQTEEREIAALPQPEVDTKKTWFISQYNVAKQQYIKNIEELISEKQEKIEEIKEEAKIAKDEYDAEMIRLKKLPASETKNVWITATQRKYNNEALERTNKINTIKNEIAELDTKIVAPDVDSILTIMSQNCNVSSIEIYEYYYKYSDHIN